VELMLQLGVIKRSQSSTYSQVLLAPKPGGKWRFCIDYRSINNCMEAMRWPLPRIDHMLQRIGDKNPRFFGVIDATSGYHQVLLDERCRKYAAFITEDGLWEPVRIAFGLKTAPSYYQQQIAGTIMSGLMYRIMEMYIDDILIHAESEKEYLHNLDLVFKRLQEFNITLNPDKCRLGLSEVEFVGTLISARGLSISPQKKMKALAFEQPETSKQLRSFLGLANYFHAHLHQFSNAAKPLFEMLKGYEKQGKKTFKLRWTEDSMEAFATIQRLIAENQLLFFYDAAQGEVYVETDASGYAIGAVIYQEIDWKNPDDPDDVIRKVKRPIRFFSQSLTGHELNWPAIEKEAFAIFRGIQEFRYLLRDIHFVLRTDHRNLKYLNLDTPKVVRWKLAIQEYNFSLEYYKGVDNVAADGLSRLPQAHWSRIPDTQADLLNHIWEQEDLDKAIEEHPIPVDKLKWIEQVHSPRCGHHGLDRTMDKLQKLLKENGMQPWKYMRQDVRKFIHTCPMCQKLSFIKPVIKANRFTLSSYTPLERISIDTLGPLPLAEDGHLYVIVFIDCFSRYVELYPVKTLEAKEAARCLIDFVGRHGEPCQIVSDNGTQFLNETLKAVYDLTLIAYENTVAYSKEENGIVERANREVLRHLRAFVMHTNLLRIWYPCLPMVQRIMNTQVHHATGLTPAEIVYGNSTRLERGMFHKGMFNSREGSRGKSMQKWMDDMLAHQEILLSTAEETLRARDDAHLAGENDSNVSEFPLHSYVLVLYPKTAMGTRPPTKLHAHWRGPLRVIDINYNEYSLQNLVTGKVELHHVTSLKQYQRSSDTPDPAIIARTDAGEILVEKILQHTGEPDDKTNMDFLVKWVGLGEEFNLWLPWAELRDNERLHEYLRSIGQARLLPKKKKGEAEDVTLPKHQSQPTLRQRHARTAKANKRA
jgi:transposase InsO family protein